MAVSTTRNLTQDELRNIHTGMVDQVYSGKQGCMCGCNGKYWKTGPMVKKVLHILKTHQYTKLQDGYILFIDYPNRDGERNYVVYLKEDEKLPLEVVES